MELPAFPADVCPSEFGFNVDGDGRIVCICPEGEDALHPDGPCGSCGTILRTCARLGTIFTRVTTPPFDEPSLDSILSRLPAEAIEDYFPFDVEKVEEQDSDQKTLYRLKIKSCIPDDY